MVAGHGSMEPAKLNQLVYLNVCWTAHFACILIGDMFDWMSDQTGSAVSIEPWPATIHLDLEEHQDNN